MAYTAVNGITQSRVSMTAGTTYRIAFGDRSIDEVAFVKLDTGNCLLQKNTEPADINSVQGKLLTDDVIGCEMKAYKHEVLVYVFAISSANMTLQWEHPFI
jgi:hypothetical protein